MTDRNGKVMGILAVHDGDDVLMISQSGMMQRIRAVDISLIGRNTQGVRIMRLDGEKLASIARIPAEVAEETTAPPLPAAPQSSTETPPTENAGE